MEPEKQEGNVEKSIINTKSDLTENENRNLRVTSEKLIDFGKEEIIYKEVLEEVKLRHLEEQQKIEEHQKPEPIFKKNLYTFDIETNKNKCFELTNGNTTLEKISRGEDWDGILCNNDNSSDKKTFSIKIENTLSGDIMIGFCMKTADHSNNDNYYDTPLSFMLSLEDGLFFSQSSPSYYHIPNFQSATNNQIYTATLDIKKKNIRFYLDGQPLGIAAKKINLRNEETYLMCPCIDLYENNDKVSLVDQEVCDQRWS